MQVDRLDFAAPPPGFERVHIHGPGSTWTLAAAWEHHKAENDPPGMLVAWGYQSKRTDGAGQWLVSLALDTSEPLCVLACDGDRRTGEGLADARRWAWAWYCFRLDAADKLGADAWPRCLAWSDEYLGAVLAALPPMSVADVLQQQLHEFGADAIGLVVRHRGRVMALRPRDRRLPAGADAEWIAESEADEFEDGPTILFGHGDTPRAALDACADACDAAEAIIDDEDDEDDADPPEVLDPARLRPSPAG